MKNKHFYNPEISNPGDFDWENDRVSYSLSQFEKLQFSTLAKVENELFKNLGKIISKSTGSQYVFDGVRDNNIQQLINLLYKVRDFIDKKVTLN
jgi:outer membrane lipopolysaccharide assembly protein LptE/RlpB